MLLIWPPSCAIWDSCHNHDPISLYQVFTSFPVFVLIPLHIKWIIPHNHPGSDLSHNLFVAKETLVYNIGQRTLWVGSLWTKNLDWSNHSHINRWCNFTIYYLGSCGLSVEKWFCGETKTNLFLISRNASKPLLMFLSDLYLTRSKIGLIWQVGGWHLFPRDINKLLSGQKMPENIEFFERRDQWLSIYRYA